MSAKKEIEDSRESDTLFGTSHAPDPVTKGAVDYAMAATDRKVSKKERLWNSIAIPFFVFLTVLGIVLAVITAYNTNAARKANNGLKEAQTQLNTANTQLQIEQKCIVDLANKLAREQSIRSDIATKDRNVTATLINKVFTTQTPEERIAAYQEYKKQIKANELSRKQHPLPTFDSCVKPGGK